MKKIILFIALLIISLACSEKDLTKEYIPSDKLVDILVDMYICDGMMNSTLLRNEHTIKDTMSNYQLIFQKYQISRNDFDSSIVILTNHPEEFILLYDKLIAKLTQIEGSISDTAKAIKRQ